MLCYYWLGYNWKKTGELLHTEVWSSSNLNKYNLVAKNYVLSSYNLLLLFQKNLKNIVHKYTFEIIVNRYTVFRGNYTRNLYDIAPLKILV